MSLEGSISKVRKAVEGSAEQLAEDDFLEHPEKGHYNKVFDTLRLIKTIEPGRYEEIIRITSRAKEFKDKIGVEKYKAFWDVFRELTERESERMHQSELAILKTEKDAANKIGTLYQKFYEILSEEIIKDSRIATEFSGQEKLLKETLDSIIPVLIKPLFLTTNIANANNMIPKKSLFTKIGEFFRSLE